MDVSLSWKQYDEQNVIKACLNQERWAQQKLYEYYYGRMMAVCLRYTSNHDEALDILQEAFLKIFLNLDRYKVGTSLYSWMRTIMVNTSLDHYRKNSKRRTDDIDEAYGLSAADPSAIDHMNVEEILKVVQELSPTYRTIFNLFAIDGYSHREISQLLGINESTSRSNLVKARVKLQRLLKKREK